MLSSDLRENLLPGAGPPTIQKVEDKQLLRAQRKLMLGTALCFLFMLTEIVGGIMAHSLAIMTDAAHMLSDVAG